MSVGLGALHDGWLAFEADEGRGVRAERLDECLAIYAGLMHGQPFTFQGRHYSARPTDFRLPPPPVHRPHPPVWVVGAYRVGRAAQPSLERAARWDGLLPAIVPEDPAAAPVGQAGYDLESFAEVVSLVRGMREEQGLPWDGYERVVEADSWGEHVQLEGGPSDWEEAGATWWVEGWWNLDDDPAGHAEVRRRVEGGPPTSH